MGQCLEGFEELLLVQLLVICTTRAAQANTPNKEVVDTLVPFLSKSQTRIPRTMWVTEYTPK